MMMMTMITKRLVASFLLWIPVASLWLLPVQTNAFVVTNSGTNNNNHCLGIHSWPILQRRSSGVRIAVPPLLTSTSKPNDTVEDDDDTTVQTSSRDSKDEFLRESLLQSVLFTSLPEESLQTLMDAFEQVEFQKNDIIYRQGDPIDYVYIVAEGECLVEVDGKPVARPYGILRSSQLFGELGVMYNRTRSSTISCRTPTVSLFRIPCNEFKNILNQRAASDIVENVDDDPEQLAALDDVMKEIEGTKSLYDGAIIRPYKPNRLWLWRQFRGTILQHVAIPTLLNMLWSAAFILFVRHKTLGASWATGIGLPPDPTNPFIAKLHMVHKIWNYQQALTTFILTFFLNQSFTIWREIYDIGRRIQGRLNDFNQLLATTAARNHDGSYTAKAEKLLDYVGGCSRLFHALLWAANARRFRVLGTPRGLERMASRGLMDSKQLDVLKNLDLPEDQLHIAPMEWMIIRTDRGISDGTLISDAAHRQMLLGQMATLRCTYAMIKDKLDGRMPLAYTHFVQVLVDVFVLTAPIALYSELGAWSIICVGVLTTFYTGLLDLGESMQAAAY